jgi:hypothetical protein
MRMCQRGEREVTYASNLLLNKVTTAVFVSLLNTSIILAILGDFDVLAQMIHAIIGKWELVTILSSAELVQLASHTTTTTTRNAIKNIHVRLCNQRKVKTTKGEALNKTKQLTDLGRSWRRNSHPWKQ